MGRRGLRVANRLFVIKSKGFVKNLQLKNQVVNEVCAVSEQWHNICDQIKTFCSQDGDKTNKWQVIFLSPPHCMWANCFSLCQKHSAHLLVPFCALCSAQCFALPLLALVTSRALGTRPGAEHRCFHTCCYLGLHFLKTPAQRDRERPRM